MKNRNLPNGTRDEFGTRAEIKETIQERLFKLFRDRGFNRLTTPILEYADVFSPLNLENVRPYQLLDEQGEALVLRPDLTLPVARMMSTTGIEVPAKWYYGGDVFRLNKQLSGSYNQVTQAGIEIVGYAGLKGEWESLAIAVQGCEINAVKDLTIELSDARFVDAVFAQLPLADPTKQALKQALFDKDLTRYQQLAQSLANTAYQPFISEWPWLFGAVDLVMATVKTLPDQEQLQPILTDLERTAQFIEAQTGDLTVVLDLSRPTPQSYYTGMAFRGYTQSDADYLFSGGRYDKLLTSFQKVQEPAVGVAFDVDALADRAAGPVDVVQTLLYFEPEQWSVAEAALKKDPNATLCLADSLAEAQAIARSQQMTLVNLAANQEVGA